MIKFCRTTLFAGCSKRLRGETREDRRAEAYSCTLTRNRSSATKHMRLFQEPARLVHFVTQFPGDLPGDSWVSHLFVGNFFAGELAQQLYCFDDLLHVFPARFSSP